MFQKILLVGYLSDEPDLKYTSEGNAVCNFSMGVNRRWTGKDGQPVQSVTWFRISAWGSVAENANQHLRKGRQVLIEGHLLCDSDTGGPKIWFGNDNKPRANFEIRAYSIVYLDSKTEDEDTDTEEAVAEEQAPV